jgi:hypothetical protein
MPQTGGIPSRASQPTSKPNEKNLTTTNSVYYNKITLKANMHRPSNIKGAKATYLNTSSCTDNVSLSTQGPKQDNVYSLKMHQM